MATDYFSETDPLTGQPKKKPATQLGYQDPNSQQPVQLSKEAMSGGATQQQQPQQPQAATQGGEQVLQTAQNQVLQQGQQPTQLQQATQQAAQKFVQDPMQGYDPAKTKQGLLEKAGVDRANMLEALRREYGGASGSGLLQKNMLENALASGVDLRNYESQLDTENYNRMLDAITRSIGVGQSVGQQQEDVFSQRLGNLAATRGMGEGERAAEQARRNQLNILGQQQEYSLETMTEQQKNDLAKMAAAQGYNLNTMNQQQINDLAKMAVSQGYNLQTIEQQQQNTLELQRLGYDQQTQLMAQQQGYDLVKLDKTFGNEMARLISATNLDTQSKSTLMELQNKLDTDTLLTTQDFQAIQNDLDRQAAVALQSNDISAQENIVRLKGEIDAKAQESQNVFNDSQRIATQAWQTGERIGEEEFAQAMNYYDWAQKNAQQNNDIEAQQTLQRMRDFTQMSMQQQDMNQEEKMANINSMLQEARANNDVERQKLLLDYTYTQDINKMVAEQGFEMGKIGVQAQIEEALQNQQFDHASAMQRSLLQAQAEQNALDRGVQEMSIQLQERGIDLNESNAEWARLVEGVNTGSIDPSSLTEYLQKTASTAGITVQPPDPTATYKEAQREYVGMQAQFGMSHPELVANPQTGELTDEGEKQFARFYNDQMFGGSYGGSVVELPTQDEISKHVTPTLSGSGPLDVVGGLAPARVLDVDRAISTKLDSMVGKNTVINGVEGKVKDWIKTPNTIQVVITTPEGIDESVMIYQAKR